MGSCSPRQHLLLLLLLLMLVQLAAAVGTQEGAGLAEKLAPEASAERPPEEEEEEEEGVLVLKEESFARALQKYQLLLVAFCAPWSELCQALAPEFAKAAAVLQDEAPRLRLAKVDATEERALKAEFRVAGYPTLKLFRGGNRNQPTDYRGEREAEEMVQWLRQKAGPSAILLEDADAAAAFLDAHPVAAIGFFRDRLEENVGLFYKVADLDPLGNGAMALTDRQELFEKYGVVAGEVVSLFRKHGDEPRADFQVDEELGLDEAELGHFLAVQSLELVMEFTSENSSRIFGAKVPNHLLLFLNKTVVSQLELLSGFRGAAAAFRGQVLFVLADVSGEGASLLQFFGLQPDEVPAIRFIHIETNTKYRLATEGLTGLSIRAFCQAVLEGRVEPHLMSREVPEDWDRRPVKTLVGKNFEQVAFEESKNVFVKFYAPWCPHSKAMAAVWEELGEKYQDHKDIIIAEMDATANEVAEITIRAYPTLYYFPVGQGRKMIEYRGARDLESFSQFLESKGELPVQVDKGGPKTTSEEPENQTSPPDLREEL
uniref:protein disulfide-isomerase n=1 Tax=Pogona vitticeps TaxID=103695 RepID=A0ABM5EZH7_9SAUR